MTAAIPKKGPQLSSKTKQQPLVFPITAFDPDDQAFRIYSIITLFSPPGGANTRAALIADDSEIIGAEQAPRTSDRPLHSIL